MLNYIRLLATFFFLIVLSSPISAAERGVFDMERWDAMLTDIANTAKQQKIKQEVINDVVKNSIFIPNVIKADQKQLEFTLTLEEYLNRTLNDNRIATGYKMFSVYPTLLSKVEKKYNIPSNVILAFWGMESNYGKVKSAYPLSNSFLSLIYEGRREQFFKNQLLALMQTSSKNKLQIQNIHGSWAGAMGHFQFIPTTLIQYGVDGNKDGRIDIINSIGDAMYSAANYLNKLGWHANEPITKQILLPYDFDRNLLNGDIKKTLQEWQSLGVMNRDGSVVTSSLDTTTGIIADTKLLAKQDLEKQQMQNVETNNTQANFIQAYLTYPNFYRIKKWNNSNWYAIAISELSNILKK